MSPIQKAAFERFSATENVIRTTAGGKDELSMELYKSIGRQLGKNRNIVTVCEYFMKNLLKVSEHFSLVDFLYKLIVPFV